jgi:hypothetical protein
MQLALKGDREEKVMNRAVFLSTFRDISWNVPFYPKLGFYVVDESELTASSRHISATRG